MRLLVLLAAAALSALAMAEEEEDEQKHFLSDDEWDDLQAINQWLLNLVFLFCQTFLNLSDRRALEPFA